MVVCLLIPVPQISGNYKGNKDPLMVLFQLHQIIVPKISCTVFHVATIVGVGSLPLYLALIPCNQLLLTFHRLLEEFLLEDLRTCHHYLGPIYLPQISTSLQEGAMKILHHPHKDINNRTLQQMFHHQQ